MQGLHHITAVASNPQANLDFYEQVLGQRLVKKTVNFDDPGTYHFYFGDEIGTPGTILTFFPWPNMHKGRRGNGEATTVSYSIPESSMEYWTERLKEKGIATMPAEEQFGANVLQFEDPDGMAIELVAVANNTDALPIQHWAEGPVPEEHALRGFFGVTLWLDTVVGTAKILTENLGYELVGQEGDRYRFKAAGTERALYVDLVHRPGESRAAFGAGSIHHIAFRTADDEEQQAYLANLHASGQQVTPVRDREYFHSIYFREPGGVLFEIATDTPGFAINEPIESLGDGLMLPPWFEGRRAELEQVLPAIKRHKVAKTV